MYCVHVMLINIVDNIKIKDLYKTKGEEPLSFFQQTKVMSKGED